MANTLEHMTKLTDEEIDASTERTVTERVIPRAAQARLGEEFLESRADIRSVTGREGFTSFHNDGTIRMLPYDYDNLASWLVKLKADREAVINEVIAKLRSFPRDQASNDAWADSLRAEFF